MTNHPDEKQGLTQKQAVLAYMLEHGEITPLDALIDLGCMRLAARIDELRAEHNIRDEWIEVPKRRGPGKTRVKRYWLERPKAAPTEQMGLLA